MSAMSLATAVETIKNALAFGNTMPIIVQTNAPNSVFQDLLHEFGGVAGVHRYEDESPAEIAATLGGYSPLKRPIFVVETGYLSKVGVGMAVLNRCFNLNVEVGAKSGPAVANKEYTLSASARNITEETIDVVFTATNDDEAKKVAARKVKKVLHKLGVSTWLLYGPAHGDDDHHRLVGKITVYMSEPELEIR